MRAEHLRPRPLRLTLAACVLTAASLAGAVEPAPSRVAADTFRHKVDAIVVRAAGEPRARHHETVVTESEVNAYLALDAIGQLPPGVTEPSVSLVGPGRIAGRAVVDLDAVRRAQRDMSLFNPMRLLGGRLPIVVQGNLEAHDGLARLVVDTAEIAGVSVPISVLAQVVGFYSRTPGRPGGWSLDDSFPLPANIRDIRLQRGRATVVQ